MMERLSARGVLTAAMRVGAHRAAAAQRLPVYQNRIFPMYRFLSSAPIDDAALRSREDAINDLFVEARDEIEVRLKRKEDRRRGALPNYKGGAVCYCTCSPSDLTTHVRPPPSLLVASFHPPPSTQGNPWVPRITTTTPSRL